MSKLYRSIAKGDVHCERIPLKEQGRAIFGAARHAAMLELTLCRWSLLGRSRSAPAAGALLYNTILFYSCLMLRVECSTSTLDYRSSPFVGVLLSDAAEARRQLAQ